MIVTILLRLRVEPVNAHRFDLAVGPCRGTRPVGLEGN